MAKNDAFHFLASGANQIKAKTPPASRVVAVADKEGAPLRPSVPRRLAPNEPEGAAGRSGGLPQSFAGIVTVPRLFWIKAFVAPDRST